MDRDSNNDGLIPLNSLSCYKEMWRLANEDRNFSTVPRPPHLLRDVYAMVDDPSTDSVVSWGDSGKSFIVWKESEFLGDVLPRCLSYEYKDMTSFTTKFHAFGYNKVEESVHWEYTANCLVRGRPPPPKDPSPYTSADLMTMVTPEYARNFEWSYSYIKNRKQ